MRAPQAIAIVSVGMLLLPAGGCDLPRRMELSERFQHEDPSVRIEAALEVGRTGNRKAVPYLVDRLTDSEPEVRFVAYLALRKITGETLGYRYYAPAAERDKAVARWRDWLKARNGQGPATRPAKEGGP